jgi:hypothetical protein
METLVKMVEEFYQDHNESCVAHFLACQDNYETDPTKQQHGIESE